MIKADIPQDVTDYKEQFFFGMNIRQFVSVAAMIALAVVTFLIGRNFIEESVLIYVIVLEVAPIAAIGFMAEGADMTYTYDEERIKKKAEALAAEGDDE